MVEVVVISTRGVYTSFWADCIDRVLAVLFLVHQTTSLPESLVL